ncbi:MAG: hypothetical protein DDG60_11005 [Anaerolineae bacterium]|nr:MAG: hypothetical protein DDG60_11005 [Anaerolineae bacterium]
MEIIGSILGLLVLASILLALFELRVRQPDTLVLYESKGKVGLREGLFYPRHFSLLLKRAPHPVQLNIEATAAGNLGVIVKLVGSVAPALDNLSALIRIGGWNSDAVARAAEQASIRLEGLVKEYAQQSEIQALSSKGLSEYLEAQSASFKDRFGLEVISLAVVSLDPADSEIAEALRQQEEARLLEQTEKLNNQARIAAAKSKYQADEEIAAMEHELELKKLALKKERLAQEDAIAQKRLEDELARSRMRLAFEKEELDILKNNPELLILTPQAARLAEASQGLKNARTVISLSAQDLANTEWGELFQKMLQKAVEKS